MIVLLLLALFVPADFKIPVTYEGNGYKLMPLGPDLVRIDYDAYMSSIEQRPWMASGRTPASPWTKP